MSSLKTTLRHFHADRSGTIPIIAALSMVGVLGTMGLAYDYSKGATAKAALNSAVDAAALAGARMAGTEAQRKQQAKKVFDANIANIAGLENVTYTPTNVLKDGTNYGFKVVATAKLKTSLSQVIGINDLSVAALGEAVGAIRSHTEVALVLDTTFSMTGWKMSALKDTAKRMVDDLSPLVSDPEYLKIGVVPFAQYINIGMANRNKSWLDVPADYKITHTWTEQTYPNATCGAPYTKVWVPATGPTPAIPAVPPTPARTCTKYNDGVPVTYSCGGSPGSPAVPASPGVPAHEEERCTYNQGPMVPVVHTWDEWFRWYGCIGSRSHPLNTQDGNYATKIPGLMNNQKCSDELLDLTTSRTAVKNLIQSFTPKGETYIPAGLIWGWRMLTPQAPFDARPNTTQSPTRKFLVLMTDGLNTKSLNAPEHEGSDGALSNQYMQQICNNIAADTANKITVLSVAFAVNDNSTKNILRNCAKATGGEFYDAQNQVQFQAAFQNITNIISELRLSK